MIQAKSKNNLIVETPHSKNDKIFKNFKNNFSNFYRIYYKIIHFMFKSAGYSENLLISCLNTSSISKFHF